VNIKKMNMGIKREKEERQITKFIKGKAIPVTGRGGPESCETSRLPQFSRQSAHRCR
jgi:hypothetical protein